MIGARIWALGALLAAIVAGAVMLEGRGYARGYAAAEARAHAARVMLTEQLGARTAALVAAEAALTRARAARAPEIERMETDAKADPDADRPALSGAAVERLRARWGAAAAAAAGSAGGDPAAMRAPDRLPAWWTGEPGRDRDHGGSDR